MQSQIQVAILEIRKPYPSDKLITSYKDFLKYRDFLKYYQFNPRVFECLIQLVFDLWYSIKRINRASLIECISTYHKHQNAKIVSPEISKIIFFLFKSFIIDKEFTYSEGLNLKIKYRLNSLLSKCQLPPSDIKILIANSSDSGIIKNRILRYPFLSPEISTWAMENIENLEYSDRRAELVSWIIDEQPGYQIPKRLLELDFEHHNYIDENEYKKHHIYLKILSYVDYAEYDPDYHVPQEKLEELYFNSEFANNNIGEGFSIEDFIGIDLTTEKLFVRNLGYLNFEPASRYYYMANKKIEILFEMNLHGLERIKNKFYDDFNKTYSIFMGWSIYYSRLDKSQKIALLKLQFYSKAIYSYYRIAKNLESIELLEWLLKYSDLK